ncbi:hypothetical protein DPMN_183854 [Dreissena polymorpha]|uniref:Uncharacterized protein n=1 Tax=Dreissena polymorpha TaxID=45954 RepID=A0A9D4DGR8_DREPO|nr:hypothetical protein DPMN_183854 [Dreissena polymorpha]
MNLLIKFHEDRTINVASRVLTRFYYNSHIRKNAPPPWQPCFSSKHIKKINLLTIFYEDWTVNVASQVLTRKNAPPPAGHVFQPTGIIFELVQDVIGMNFLTKFHENWTINVASRVLTRFYYSHIRKNAPPLGSHVFQANVTIFELIQDIIGTNLLSKFHEDRKINVASRVLTRKNAPPLAAMFFNQPASFFALFHEDQTINVVSRVLTRFYYSHVRKNAPPLGSHVFQANIPIFELIQYIIKTNLLTKFHED